MWTTIHWATSYFPSDCNSKLKERYWRWIQGFGYAAPCPKCRHNWRCILKSLHRHRTWIMHSNQTLSCMFYDLHNIWNALLGKAIFSFELYRSTYNVDFNYRPMFDEICDDRFSIDRIVGDDISSSEASSNPSDEPTICVLDADDTCDCRLTSRSNLTTLV